jgi:hypothetical protein
MLNFSWDAQYLMLHEKMREKKKKKTTTNNGPMIFLCDSFSSKCEKYF